MNPAPLAALRLRPQDHLSALWWLTLLYRSPRAFLAEMNALGRGQHFAAARLYLHALPYVVVVAVLGRLFIFGVLGIGLEFAPTKLGFWPILIRHGRGLAVGVAVGLVFGMALGIAFGVVMLLVFRFGFRFAFRSTFGLMGGIASGNSRGRRSRRRAVLGHAELDHLLDDTSVRVRCCEGREPRPTRAWQGGPPARHPR